MPAISVHFSFTGFFGELGRWMQAYPEAAKPLVISCSCCIERDINLVFFSWKSMVPILSALNLRVKAPMKA